MYKYMQPYLLVRKRLIEMRRQKLPEPFPTLLDYYSLKMWITNFPRNEIFCVFVFDREFTSYNLHPT